MRNAANIFRGDLRLIASNAFTFFFVVVLCLVPVVFAWFGVASNWESGSSAGQLKIAVANGDEGYESSLVPIELNIGDRVANKLNNDDEYNWVLVDEDAAIEGVRSGEYYAAVVIPGDFSTKLMSVLASDDERANVDYYLNMKENPVAPVLAGEGSAGVVEDVRAKFTATVDETVLGLTSDLVSFTNSDGAKDFGARLAARLDEVTANLDDASKQVRAFAGFANATAELTKAFSKALSGSDNAADATGGTIAATAEGLDAAVTSAQSAAADIDQLVRDAQLKGEIGNVGTETAQKLASDVAALSTSVDSIARQSDAVAKALQDTSTSLAGSTDSVTSNLEFVRNDLNVAANKLSAASSKVRKFEDDVAAAIAKGNLSTVATIVGSNAASIARWLADPVSIEQRTVYPVANLASSTAPFYLVLSIWIGAFLLALLMKTAVTRERIRGYEKESGRVLKPAELYFGRFLTFAVLTLAQTTVAALGCILFLGVQCAHPLLLIVACWVSALVLSSVVYTLVLSFGGIGKVLCAIMLVMLVVGLGGEYPIQMMGGFSQVVYLLLPFTHAMHAMQSAIAGIHGAEFALDLLRTLAFLIPSLLLGLALRAPAIRVMNALTTKLEEIGFM